MKATRILVITLLLASIAGSAHAQLVRLSWVKTGVSNGCDPQLSNLDFTAAGTYTLVESVTGLDPVLFGHDSRIKISPGGASYPDAWNFDDAGCNAGFLSVVSTAVNATTCPSLKGANSSPINSWAYDPVSNSFKLALTITFDPFDPNPATRYTMWKIVFDHTNSVPGSDGGDPATCDHLDQGLLIDAFNGTVIFNTTSGGDLVGQPQPGDRNPVTTNGGPAVPTQSGTWAKLKGQYR